MGDAGAASLEPWRALLRDVLGEDAVRAWLVGGVVRDALIGRPLLDVDVAIDGDARRAARAIADAIGGAAFALGDRDAPGDECWRVTPDPTSTGVLAVQVDVCPLRGGSIEHDLAARDFTANALAVAVSGAAHVLACSTGLDDLHAGVVRMVDEQALDADPLRMLRAARIAHQLDWVVDDATRAAIRSRAARMVEPAGERTFHELRLLLLHPEARRGWRWLEQLGLDEVLLPELDACRGMRQSRFHHLDVHDHTLAVLDNCEDLLEATDFWLPLPSEPGFVAQPWSEQQRLVVLLAALCHDLGKPITRTERGDGSVGFVGHDAAGQVIVEAIAERWRWSSAMRRQVSRLVGTHLALGYLLHGGQGLRERWHLRRSFGDVAAEAIVLSMGDRLATAGPDDRRRWVRAHMFLARELWVDHWREQRDGVPTPLLDGRLVAEIAGIAPGPRVGELVELLAQEQAVGDVTTTSQARAFITREAQRLSEA